MKPSPAESERELLLTVAKVLRAVIDDPTRGADDHLYLDALDAAIKRVEASDRSAGSTVQVIVEEGPMFRPTIMAVSRRIVGDAAS